MKSNKLRTILPLVLLVIVGIGYVTKFSIGTPSALGWGDIALMCPLGALGTMLAEKFLIPRALISLVIVVILLVLFGRAFCAWLCPVPPLSRLRDIFRGKTTEEIERDAESANRAAMKGADTSALTEEEKALLSTSCSSGCSSANAPMTSRHWVLAAALISTLIFGFPVFCLVCPVGLSFATVLLVIRLFAVGDVTWTLIFVPLVLLVEVVFFRKWCHTFCPLGAFMSLVGKANKTFRPVIDDSVCIETSTGNTCQRCAHVCPEGINPRDILKGTAMNECTKCRRCVDVCPSGALTMPFLASAAKTPAAPAEEIAAEKPAE